MKQIQWKRMLCLVLSLTLVLSCIGPVPLIHAEETVTESKIANTSVSIYGQNAADYSSSYSSARMLDGDTTTKYCWHTKTGVTEAYVTFDLGASMELSRITVHARQYTGCYDRCVKDYAVYVSDTAPTYSDTYGEVPTNLPDAAAVTGTMEELSAENLTGDILLPEGAKGQYVTLHIKNIYDTVDLMINIAEVEFYTTRDVEAENQVIPFNNENIKYVGRWLTGEDQAEGYWSGTYFETKFTGSVFMVSLGEAAYIYVAADGQEVCQITTSTGYVDLSGYLDAGLTEHTVRVGIASDTGSCLLIDKLLIGKGESLIAPDEKLLIEYIGDSITAGSKLTPASANTYAFMTSEILNADYAPVAIGGIALIDGNNGNRGNGICTPTTAAMNQRYFWQKPLDKDAPNGEWDFSTYAPDLIVINLGTNDNVAGASAEDFASAYVQFVQDIRAKRGSEVLIMMMIPFQGLLEDGVRKAHADLNDANTYLVDTTDWIDATTDLIDSYHPTKEGHQKAAENLAAEIRTILIDDAIADAEAASTGVEIIDNTTPEEVGSGRKFVTTEEMTALTDAITAASTGKESAVTLEEILQVKQTLDTAVELFQSNIKIGTADSQPSTETKVDNTSVSIYGQNAADYNSSYSSARMLDGDTTTKYCWHTKTGVTEAYVTFDLGASMELSRITVHARQYTECYDRCVKDYAVYVSDTAPTYSDTYGEVPTNLPDAAAVTGTMEELSAENLTGDILLPEGTKGQYVTLHIKNIYDTVDLMINIAEVEFYVVEMVMSTDVSLNVETLTMTAGETAKLTAEVMPENTTYKTVVWDSSNEAVAVVDDSGKVTAVAEGTATITATTVDGSNKTASCLVTVLGMPTVTIESVAESNGKVTVQGTSTNLGQRKVEVIVNEDLNLRYVAENTEDGRWTCEFDLPYNGEYEIQAAVRDYSDFNKIRQTTPNENYFMLEDASVWGATVTQHTDGLYYMLFSTWDEYEGFRTDWYHYSEISYAVSTKLEGPYVYQGKALEKTYSNTTNGKPVYWDIGIVDVFHNPTLLHSEADGKYYLYFMGVSTADVNKSHRTQRIGVAYADSPAGPWTVVDHPVIDVREGMIDERFTSNPSVTEIKQADGSYLYYAVYKAADNDGNNTSSYATASSPVGPFDQSEERIMVNENSKFSVEDCFVWRNNGQYYALAKDMSGGDLTGYTDGFSYALYESLDGVNWYLSENNFAYPATIPWERGETKVSHLERAQLYVVDGIPFMLCTATTVNGESPYNGNTPCNVQIPLLGVLMAEDTQTLSVSDLQEKTVNKEKLQSLLDSAEQAEEIYFMPDTWKALQSAERAAQIIADRESAEQEDVDFAVAQLENLLNEQVEPAEVPVNIVLNKPATATSNYDEGDYYIDKAIDGSHLTRWSCVTGVSGNVELEINLVGTYSLDSFYFRQYMDRITGYTWYYHDGTNWVECFSSSDGVTYGSFSGEIETDKLKLEITGYTAAPSIYEIEVYGTLVSYDSLSVSEAIELLGTDTPAYINGYVAGFVKNSDGNHTAVILQDTVTGECIEFWANDNSGCREIWNTYAIGDHVTICTDKIISNKGLPRAGSANNRTSPIAIDRAYKLSTGNEIKTVEIENMEAFLQDAIANGTNILGKYSYTGMVTNEDGYLYLTDKGDGYSLKLELYNSPVSATFVNGTIYDVTFVVLGYSKALSTEEDISLRIAIMDASDVAAVPKSLDSVDESISVSEAIALLGTETPAYINGYVAGVINNADGNHTAVVLQDTVTGECIEFWANDHQNYRDIWNTYEIGDHVIIYTDKIVSNKGLPRAGSSKNITSPVSVNDSYKLSTGNEIKTVEITDMEAFLQDAIANGTNILGKYSYTGMVTNEDGYLYVTDKADGYMLRLALYNSPVSPEFEKGKTYNVTFIVSGYSKALSTAENINLRISIMDESDVSVVSIGEVVSQQLNLGDDLTMNFNVTAQEGTLVKVTAAGKENTYDLSTMTPDENGQYMLSVKLAAAQMTEQILVDFSMDGTSILQKQYSVRDYAIAILEGDYSDTTKAMVRQMLHYGAAAQQYFDYNTGSLANADYEVTETVALPTTCDPMVISGQVDGIRFYGASLVFENQIAVRYYFVAENGVENISFTANGISYKAVEKSGMYYVEIPEINPQHYDKSITLSVVNGEKTLTVSYSPLNYILRMSEKSSTSSNLKSLLNALYSYHMAAVAYVAENNT